jgi:hypothetical protein
LVTYSSPDYQHGNQGGVTLSNVTEGPIPDVIRGIYNTSATFELTSEHLTEEQHPYPNPDGSLHHHDAVATPFVFRQDFNLNKDPGFGGEPGFLPGRPNNYLANNPFASSYDLVFYSEQNAIYDRLADWTGKINMPQSGGGTLSFSFTFGGIGLGVTWTNGPAPGVQELSFHGNVNQPIVTFRYNDGFTLLNGSLEIDGYGKAKDPFSSDFGRLGTSSDVTILEDYTIPGDRDARAILSPRVYDVEHGAPVPEPSTFLAALLALSGWAMKTARAKCTRPRSSI